MLPVYLIMGLLIGLVVFTERVFHCSSPTRLPNTVLRTNWVLGLTTVLQISVYLYLEHCAATTQRFDLVVCRRREDG